MADAQKSCLGFLLLGAAVFLGLLAWLAVWYGIDLRSGLIVGAGVFAFFLVLAAYSFLQIRDWSWLPVLLGSLYAVLPDILLGPQDDLLVLIAGAVLSGILGWWRQRREKTDLSPHK
ncbi:MAG: hypothetical protein HYZ26_02985 [Chloroflexi bacterium]|nr:hypothetical protein [Chloroflexota bacterium]